MRNSKTSRITCLISWESSGRPAWILWVCSWGPFNSKQSCFYRRVWDWHAYKSRGFLQHKLYFSCADAIISMILEMVSFSVPCDMYPAQSLRIHSSFTTHLVYAHTSRKTCFGREWERFTSRYCQHILHTKCFQQVCSYFSKIKGI